MIRIDRDGNRAVAPSDMDRVQARKLRRAANGKAKAKGQSGRAGRRLVDMGATPDEAGTVISVVEELKAARQGTSVGDALAEALERKRQREAARTPTVVPRLLRGRRRAGKTRLAGGPVASNANGGRRSSGVIPKRTP